MLVASSVLGVGVKVPVQTILSGLVMLSSEPLETVMSSELENKRTASAKTRITVALSPTLSAVSERVKLITGGAWASTK